MLELISSGWEVSEMRHSRKGTARSLKTNAAPDRSQVSET